MARQAAEAGAVGTRERILEAALDLFLQHGYDKASLREIAERVGVTKAALYYYFPSKEEILLALADDALPSGPPGVMSSMTSDRSTWAATIDALIDLMLGRRRTFLLLERNQHVLAHIREAKGLPRREHQEPISRVVADPRVPLLDRVRLVAAIGAVMGILAGSEAFAEVPPEEFRAAVHRTVHDLIGMGPDGVPVPETAGLG